MDKAIIIFTRVPMPGHTKTRMMPYFTGVQCAKLHACFLKDIELACRGCDADVIVSYTPKEGLPGLKKLLGADLCYIPQVGKSLGEKMYRTFETVLSMGYESCLLIGTDVPELKEEHLSRAFQILQKKEIVFGKTKDGGYYLIGMKKPYKEAFLLDRYGHGKVLEDTVKDLEEAQISVGYTNALQDMDLPGDLRAYRDRMRSRLDLRRTHTGRYLARNSWISIIVPVYNEEKTIVKMQEQLEPLKDKCEILFVDGGSTDQTLKLIKPDSMVLHSQKGRANQMNLGAVKSCGDILFFLHCDSELPSHPLAHIRKVMLDYRAGCFGIAFHSPNFFMLTCRVISNHRIKDRKVMFGDQGIFIDRDLFFEAGMFPDIPIMEDYQFSLTLKEMDIPLGIAGKRIYTSDRRFPKGTIPKLKMMWKMNRLRKMYRDGVSIQKIATLYRDIR